MLDYFLLLDVARRPWIDEDFLKKHYFCLTSKIHPDKKLQTEETLRKKAEEQLNQVNQAYLCLKEPRLRLKHLIELEGGFFDKKLQNIPKNLLDLFSLISELCQKADHWIQKKSETRSPLILAKITQETANIIMELDHSRDQVREMQEEMLREIRRVDEKWDAPIDVFPTRRKDHLTCLSRISGELNFVNRWLEQLNDRYMKLAL